jgi:outer membrane receptor protein involved in Fe transport
MKTVFARIWLLVVPLFFHCMGLAQFSAHTGTLQGTVLDAQSNQPLAGTSLHVLGTGKGALTNAQGIFEVSGIPSGKHWMVVAFTGYDSDTLPVDIFPAQRTRMEVYLQAHILEIPSVEIASGKPQGLSLINRLDLSLRPVNSSQELLRTVPGVFIAQHAGGGKAEQIFLRGFDIDHGTDLALSMDGIPVNMVSHAHGQGYADAHFIIPETVERLAIDKGPYEAHQGNLATAGSIDFQTKNSLDKNLIKVEGGMYHTYRALAMLKLGGPAGKSNQSDAWVAGEYLYNKGYFEAPQNLHRVNLIAKYRKLLTRRTLLTATVSDFRSQWNASGQIPDRAVDSGLITRWGSIDPTEGGSTTRSNLNVQLASSLPGNWTWRQQAYTSHYTFNLFSNFTFFAADSVHGDAIQQVERRWLYGYKTSVSKTTTLLKKHLYTEAGLGVRLDDVGNIGLYRAQAREFLSRMQQGSVRERNAFSYLMGRLSLSHHLDVTAALRADYLHFAYTDRMEAQPGTSTAAAAILSPKVGLDYYVHDGRLHFFAKVGTGYHSNDTRVVIDGSAQHILPRAMGADVGALFKPVANVLIQVALWGLDMQQEFVYVGDEGIVEPSGKSRRYGVDFSGRWQALPWLAADMDLNIAHPRGYDDAGTARYIPLAPWLTSTGGLTAAFTSAFKGNLRYRYLGDRAADEAWDLTADGYFLLDAAFSYTLKNRYTIGLSGQNLLNTAWKEAQFSTTSRLPGEAAPVTEIHYTPGGPLALKLSLSTQF